MFDIAIQRLALFGYAKARVERPGLLPKRTPRVSVVVPCYNYGRYIPACIESILTQPGVEVDILIIDDASTDRSVAAIRDAAEKHSRVKAIYHKQNKGHIATYNDGLFRVDGDYVVLLSADDLLAPGSLLRATALMEANPRVGLAYGLAADFVDTPPAQNHDGATSWTIWRGHDWLEDRCRTGRNALRCPEAIMRTPVLHSVGGYEPDLPHAGDFHVWMKAASISDVGYIGGATQAYYRVHSDNMHNVMFNRSESKGMIIDLQQRYACFADVLQDSPRIAKADELFDKARRSLACEALTLAIRGYEWGLSDEWPIAELTSFAEQLYPPHKVRSLWRALALRRRVGSAHSGRHPLFLPNNLRYKVRCSLEEWRWRQAGI
jgi:glycosyltransferase involved in cell wall biosynthesis